MTQSKRTTLLWVFALVSLLGCAQCMRIDLFDEESYIATVVEDGSVYVVFTKAESSTFTLDSYVSAVQFDIISDETDEAFVVHPPKVSVVQGDGIISPIFTGIEEDVTVANDDYDVQDSATLQLAFNCVTEGVGIVDVKFSFEVNGKRETYKIYVRKECSGQEGPRGGLIIETEKDRKDVVRHGVVQSLWSLQSFEFEDDEPTSVSQDSHATSFLIRMENNWGNQAYYKPFVEVSDDEVLSVESRGTASQGNIASPKQEQQLVISYKCLKEGVATVQITIDLFDNFFPVTFGWTKECSTMARSDQPALLNVGLGVIELNSVAINNTPRSEWDPDSPTTTIRKEVLETNFFVTATSNTAEFIAPVVTVMPPNLLDVTVTGEARNGGTVETFDPSFFKLNFFCKKSGKARVNVMLHQPSHNTLEFGFYKECGASTPKRSDTWTANQLMVLTSFLIAILAFVAYSSFQTSKHVTQLEKRRSPIPITPDREFV